MSIATDLDSAEDLIILEDEKTVQLDFINPKGAI